MDKTKSYKDHLTEERSGRWLKGLGRAQDYNWTGERRFMWNSLTKATVVESCWLGVLSWASGSECLAALNNHHQKSDTSRTFKT